MTVLDRALDLDHKQIRKYIHYFLDCLQTISATLIKVESNCFLQFEHIQNLHLQNYLNVNEFYQCEIMYLVILPSFRTQQAEFFSSVLILFIAASTFLSFLIQGEYLDPKWIKSAYNIIIEEKLDYEQMHLFFIPFVGQSRNFPFRSKTLCERLN